MVYSFFAAGSSAFFLCVAGFVDAVGCPVASSARIEMFLYLADDVATIPAFTGGTQAECKGNEFVLGFVEMGTGEGGREEGVDVVGVKVHISR